MLQHGLGETPTLSGSGDPMLLVPIFSEAQESQPTSHLGVASRTWPGLPIAGVSPEFGRADRTHMLHLNWETAC